MPKIVGIKLSVGEAADDLLVEDVGVSLGLLA